MSFRWGWNWPALVRFYDIPYPTSASVDAAVIGFTLRAIAGYRRSSSAYSTLWEQGILHLGGGAAVGAVGGCTAGRTLW